MLVIGARDLSGLKDEFSESSEVTWKCCGVTGAMLDSLAPDAQIGLHPHAQTLADRASGGEVVAALPPLVIELEIFDFRLLGDDVLALGLAKF